MHKLKRTFFAVWCLVMPPLPAEAVCNVAANGLSFGVVDVVRGSTTASEIVVRCDVATGFEVALVDSRGPGRRTLDGPNGSKISYDLYPDATFKLPWTDGTGGGSIVGGVNDGTAATRLPIYAVIPRQRPVPPGSYADHLTVVLTF